MPTNADRARVRASLFLLAAGALPVFATLGLLAGAGTPGAALASTTICHKPGTPAQQTMVVDDSSLPAHQGHGDTIGPCAAPPSTSPPTTTPPPTAPPPTSPPTTVPTPPTTGPTTPTTAAPSDPSEPPEEPPEESDEVTVEVAGGTTIRTDTSAVGRAFVAGETVSLTGAIPAGCRPVLRVDGRVVGPLDPRADGTVAIDVATDDLAAGRHVAEVVCGSDVALRKAFWIAAPVTSNDVLSVGALSALTLGALGWVGLSTLRDGVGGAPSASKGREPRAGS